MTEDTQKPFPPAPGPIAELFGIDAGIAGNGSDNGVSGNSAGSISAGIASDKLNASVSPTAPPPKELPVVEGELVKSSDKSFDKSSDKFSDKSYKLSDKDVSKNVLSADSPKNAHPLPRGAPLPPKAPVPPRGPHADELVDVFGGYQIASVAKPGLAVAGKIIKAALPYVAVFAIGVFVYYFFFSNTDIGSWFRTKPTSQIAGAQTNKSKALAELQKDNLGSYQTWVNQFFFDVSDPKVIDPDTDYSGNGLTNFQKYLLNLNPKVYDTIGRGYPDGITVVNGIDPATGQLLEGGHKDIIDKYFDTQAIRDRVTSANLNGTGTGPGSGMGNGGAGATSEVVTAILPRGPQIASAASVAGGQQAAVQTSAQTGQPAPQTASSFGSSGPSAPAQSSQPATTDNASAAADTYQYENVLDINTNVLATLEIPKLGITAPLFFSKSIDAMYTDLKNGVAHFTGTPLPGDHGTSYIVGHSSNYAWVVSKYKRVFATLDKLNDGETFTVTVTLKNGQERVITYKVNGRGLYLPDDQSQFVNYAASRMALSTCWPLNTTQKRLVVFGEVVDIK